jgi:hypothetical protein
MSDGTSGVDPGEPFGYLVHDLLFTQLDHAVSVPRLSFVGQLTCD